uniref:RIMS binding protein 2a n=1 Tax=Gadus morhua TaxID=8049 RepID=A0A8C4ZJT2_GADMO
MHDVAKERQRLQVEHERALELLHGKQREIDLLQRVRPDCKQCTWFQMEDEVSPSPRSKARYTGQVRLCSARYSYNPYDGPNEHPEAELPLVAGKYLYVYGNMDDDGFYEGELLDGQRGLVPSNFVEFVQDKEKLAIQAGDEGEELGQPGHAPLCIMGGPPDPEDLAEDVVPYPRRINLIKQLARSVIVGWDPPLVSRGWSAGMSGYAVLVDGELRATVALGGRTKCLLEKLDLDGCVHRVSVQSTTDRGPSDELRCTLLVGANVVVAACGLRVDDIQRDTAELSWLPSNSNYGHTIFLDGAEHAAVKPGRCRLRFVNLKAMTVYKVTVVARPHQVPWQLPLEQREKKEAGVEFCTLAAGPPLAPQEVQVLCGQAPGVLQVHWKPPPLSPTGTSNGANVIGYVVCTKGQRIAEVLYPLADYVSVELTRIQCLEAREVIVRTLSAQGESQDSPVAVIPNNLLVPPPPLALPPPGPQPLALTLHPHRQPGAWDPARMAPPQVHTLEAPPSANPRSPSPQRILPQPRGTLIPDTVAKAIAREAAQRVAAESGKQPFHQRHSDEEEEDEEGLARGRRRGPSVDEFLRASELGRPPHYSHSEEYHSESSRGSDLSDILEEDEEELYSEMQLNDEGRRRSSHHALKAGSSPGGRHDRENGRRGPQGPRGGPQPQRRPLMVPSIDGGHRERERRSPPYYSDSKPEESFRIFVALFDYDPLSMSPNPDAADEELPFKEGQIIRVYGDKDTDGFYRGEVCGRMGLIPCNMVSEIRAEDDETLDQLIKQGFLPLNTPIDRIEQNRRGQRRDQATRRMVALYDYDPRESSPNVDVETELTFCAGDIMAVFGEIDEDGFYYGDINGHRGLVPSNFLEEVPDDVEVYLTDIPSHHHHHPPQEESGGRAPANSSHCSSSAANAEGKRVHHHRRSQR